MEGKFRVWDKKMGRFVPPEFLEQVFLRQDGALVWWDADGFDVITDKGFVVQFYTGFEDKSDVVKIFAGDIVKAYMGNVVDDILVVEWRGPWKYAAFGLGGRRKEQILLGDPDWTWDLLNHSQAKECVVIGNVCENPDLVRWKEGD